MTTPTQATVPSHGDPYRYKAGCRCDECRTAWRDLMREHREDRFKRGLPDGDPRHGTPNGYHNWGCRCTPCSDAWAGELAEYRAARARKMTA